MLTRTFATLFLLSPLMLANAGVIIIDAATDSFTGVGDFAEISGFDDASSPGQVLEVLGGSGSTAADFATGNTLTFGELWSFLDGAGVTTASTLGFGFGINETGATGTNWVDVTAISFDFDGTIFDLDGDSLQVFNYNQGQSTAEAIFFIDLGLDFMSTYNAGSTEELFISAILDNTDDGFEILFLGSAFSGGPVDPCDTNPPGQGGCPPEPMPEPGILMLLGAGLLGLALGRRRRA